MSNLPQTLATAILRRSRARYLSHIADPVDSILRAVDPRDFRELFERVWPRLQWDHRPTARRLYLLAKNGPGSGEIVEVGSFLGNSTIFLAAGAASTGRERVHAIDPHTEESMVQAPKIANVAALFLENLRAFGVLDRVVYCPATSTEIAQTWSKGPVRLLFIDGLHTYRAVIDDFVAWYPHLASNHVVVFDDFLWPEVEDAVRYLMGTYPSRWFAVRGGQAIFSTQRLPLAMAGLP